MNWQPTLLPYTSDLETKPVLKALNRAHRALAELKGVARSIPRQDILINSLGMQEARDSSEFKILFSLENDYLILNISPWFVNHSSGKILIHKKQQ